MRTNTAPGLALAEEFPLDAGADEQLQFLLRYAVFAPSSHNTQPWLFRIQGHELDLIADLNRSLPIVDPMNRELIISCGAALNHLQTATRYFRLFFEYRNVSGNRVSRAARPLQHRGPV
jgi:nitroreductase